MAQRPVRTVTAAPLSAIRSRPSTPTQRRARAHDASVASRHLLALFTAGTLDGLMDAAFEMLMATVACDFVSALYRNAGSGLLKERDSRGHEPGPEFMRRYAELTPAMRLARDNPGARLLATRTALPRSSRALRKMAFYREIMQPQGWRHAVALCFWGEPRAELPIFVTSLYRREGQHDFSRKELATLEGVYPFLECAVNRIHDREAATTIREGMASTARNATRGLAILDRNLLVMHANHATLQLCAAWTAADPAIPIRDPPQTRRLPPTLVAACREMHDEWRALVTVDPDATGLRRHRLVSHPRVSGLTASVTMVCPSTVGLAEPTFIVEFDRRVHGVALDAPDRRVPLLRKLTTAECAVAVALADGLSNQEIGDRLGKTVHAVKFLLHRVYQKTGVPNRATLVAVLRSRPTRSRKPPRAR